VFSLSAKKKPASRALIRSTFCSSPPPVALFGRGPSHVVGWPRS
jgi:hypothetical protein